MHVAFRVDASEIIGTGHVKRCGSLADALEKLGVEQTFIVRELGLDVSSTLFGYNCIGLRRPSVKVFEAEADAPAHSWWACVSQEDDAAETIAALSSNPPDWLIVDHYAFDHRWHSRIRNALGCKIAVIDDLADRKLDADIVIDHNWHLDHKLKYGGLISSKTKIFGGPKFALLGSDYAEAARYVFNEEVRSIGIFMGGVDRLNVSETALDAVQASGFAGRVEVVSTSANPNLARLKARIDKLPNTALTLDETSLAGFFGRHDLQIGAGGGATWERFCIGVPTIAVACADNQRAVLKEMVRDEYEFGVDTISSDLIAEQLISLVCNAKLRAKIAKKSSTLIDGHGGARAASQLIKEGRHEP